VARERAAVGELSSRKESREVGRVSTAPVVKRVAFEGVDDGGDEPVESFVVVERTPAGGVRRFWCGVQCSRRGLRSCRSRGE